jgi:hypothetical protein
MRGAALLLAVAVAALAAAPRAGAQAADPHAATQAAQLAALKAPGRFLMLRHGNAPGAFLHRLGVWGRESLRMHPGVKATDPAPLPKSSPFAPRRRPRPRKPLRPPPPETGNGDPPNMRLGDCATQRNLDDLGRRQARAMGAAIRAALGPALAARAVVGLWGPPPRGVCFRAAQSRVFCRPPSPAHSSRARPLPRCPAALPPPHPPQKV